MISPAVSFLLAAAADLPIAEQADGRAMHAGSDCNGVCTRLRCRRATRRTITALPAPPSASPTCRARGPTKPPRALNARPKWRGRLIMTPEEDAEADKGSEFRPAMRVNGQPRTSLITNPADGRVPADEAGAAPDPRYYTLKPGEKVTDGPELQPIDDRCILPICNNAGPVMLPLPSNSNYQIVQTADHVRDPGRDDPRCPHRAPERQPPQRRPPALSRRLHRLVGGRDAGRRNHALSAPVRCFAAHGST